MKEESIDFKAITARVVTELGMPIERIRERLLEKVWMSCMEVLNKAGADAEPLLAEKALSELLKKDVVREKVVYKKDSFRLRLENGRYRVYMAHTVPPLLVPGPLKNGMRSISPDSGSLSLSFSSTRKSPQWPRSFLRSWKRFGRES